MVYTELLFFLGVLPVSVLLSFLDRSAEYKNLILIITSAAFISWGNHWEFVQGDYSAALDRAASQDGMGFGQASIIHKGLRVAQLWRSGVNHYRALCEKQGQLCIVDSREAVEYSDFVDMLERYGVNEALYLDMGAGWNHSWWRDADGTVHEIHPRLDKSRYCTNWIVFYRL